MISSAAALSSAASAWSRRCCWVRRAVVMDLRLQHICQVANKYYAGVPSGRALARQWPGCNTGLFKLRAELADLGGDAKAGKRRAVNIFSAIGLVSTAIARRADDREGLVALLRH
jgi:hypothetical protein